MSKPPTRRGMARCLVCNDSRRTEIEQSVARGGSKRDVAAAFPPLKPDSVWRHWTNHVSDEQKAALKTQFYRPGIPLEELIEDTGTVLLNRLQNYRAKLAWHMDSASDAGDHKTVATVAGQLLKLEELAAKANGDLVRHAGKRTVTHVHLSPEWQSFQAAILTILRRHPAAYEDVVRVFREREEAERAKMLPGPTTIEATAINAS
jgi:hypothetical protein